VQTRQRHPPFSCLIAISSGVSLRIRSRRIIASSIAHTQSSARDPTMSARNGKKLVGAGVGVEPPLASKGDCKRPEEGALVFCGLAFPSRHRLWVCSGQSAAVAGRGRRSELLRCCLWSAFPESWPLQLLIEHGCVVSVLFVGVTTDVGKA
jgi:hypothetical protein